MAFFVPIIYPGPPSRYSELNIYKQQTNYRLMSADVSWFRLAPLCDGAELTGESYWFQFPFSSSQYQSHSVVSRKVGWRTEEMEERRLTFWNPRVMVSNHTAPPSTMLQETSHTVDPQYVGLEITSAA